jgi:hypothetical protein
MIRIKIGENQDYKRFRAAQSVISRSHTFKICQSYQLVSINTHSLVARSIEMSNDFSFNGGVGLFDL